MLQPLPLRPQRRFLVKKPLQCARRSFALSARRRAASALADRTSERRARKARVHSKKKAAIRRALSLRSKLTGAKAIQVVKAPWSQVCRDAEVVGQTGTGPVGKVVNRQPDHHRLPWVGTRYWKPWVTRRWMACRAFEVPTIGHGNPADIKPSCTQLFVQAPY